jgi:hypothetical protein
MNRTISIPKSGKDSPKRMVGALLLGVPIWPESTRQQYSMGNCGNLFPSRPINEGSPMSNINLTLLIDGIKRAKRQGEVLCLRWTRAFYTVPHTAFLSALAAQGAHALLPSMLCNIHTGVTIIFQNGQNVQPIGG